jgi:hypothetical protein
MLDHLFTGWGVLRVAVPSHTLEVPALLEARRTIPRSTLLLEKRVGTRA